MRNQDFSGHSEIPGSHTGSEVRNGESGARKTTLSVRIGRMVTFSKVYPWRTETQKLRNPSRSEAGHEDGWQNPAKYAEPTKLRNRRCVEPWSGRFKSSSGDRTRPEERNRKIPRWKVLEPFSSRWRDRGRRRSARPFRELRRNGNSLLRKNRARIRRESNCRSYRRGIRAKPLRTTFRECRKPIIRSERTLLKEAFIRRTASRFSDSFRKFS